MAHIQYVDGLIREYLLFRGLPNSLKTFDSELKNDKDKGFRVDKIIEQITHSISVQDLQGLRELWNHLDGHLFSKLEHSFASGKISSKTYYHQRFFGHRGLSIVFVVAVKKLEHSVLKLYLVTAFTCNKPEKITEFFTKLAQELHSQNEWKEWFCMSVVDAKAQTGMTVAFFISFQFFRFAKIPKNTKHSAFVSPNSGRTHYSSRCTIS